MKNFTPYKGATQSQKMPDKASERSTPTQPDTQRNPASERSNAPLASKEQQTRASEAPSEYHTKPTIKELGRRYKDYLDFHNRLSLSITEATLPSNEAPEILSSEEGE